LDTAAVGKQSDARGAHGLGGRDQPPGGGRCKPGNLLGRCERAAERDEQIDVKTIVAGERTMMQGTGVGDAGERRLMIEIGVDVRCRARTTPPQASGQMSTASLRETGRVGSALLEVRGRRSNHEGGGPKIL
jgi:hypothetical protein